MVSEFSSGSQGLDMLLEELRAGDNVVLYTEEEADYVPFVSAFVQHSGNAPIRIVYVRYDGLLEAVIATVPETRREVIDLRDYLALEQPIPLLQDEFRRIGERVCYFFDPLATELACAADRIPLRVFFLSVCPLLFQLNAVAYWNLVRGDCDAGTIAAIKDCTQVFIKLERVHRDMIITPIKVWGRYSDAMFQPHRVVVDNSTLVVHPHPVGIEDHQSYVTALEEKGRELAEIRDALDSKNQELTQRNEELAVLNARLQEQSRLYQSLSGNLEHLKELFRAGQVIGASLAVDQVRHAVSAAALSLFEACACRLQLTRFGAQPAFARTDGDLRNVQEALDSPAIEQLRARAMQSLQPQALTVTEVDSDVHSVAIAPLLIRGRPAGALEMYAPDLRFASSEAQTLLGYLASEASIALDHAYLYQEVELQGEQLRSFVDKVITNEESDSRRLAFDLHDGLVQIIVAAYQHLQTAQGWRERDPLTEQRELEAGIQLLRRAIHEARRLIGQLRPAGLDDLGLAHALRLYIAQISADADWQVALEIDPQWPALPPSLEAAIFRIIQEATTNALKYAQAARAQVQLRVLEHELYVGIRDWGQGFDLASISSPSPEGLHIGLIGIRERARLWGGRCVISSQIGKGARIEVFLPDSVVPRAEPGDSRD